MERKNFTEMTDQELLVEKKRLKESKLFHAVSIGFLAGILIFGIGAWIMSEQRQIGFFIPMIFPIVIIFKLIKKSKSNEELEQVLKERKL
jgi:uncharacterized membrane protein YiaA